MKMYLGLDMCLFVCIMIPFQAEDCARSRFRHFVRLVRARSRQLGKSN